MQDNPPSPAPIPPALPHSTGAGLFFRAAVVIVILLALLALGRQFGSMLPQFAAWVAEWGAFGPMIFIGGYIVAVVALVPASLLTLASGALFGLTAGVIYVFLAATIGALLSFLLARYVARGTVEKWMEGDIRFASIDRAVAAEGRRIVFLLRLSPAFPFGLLNYALGLTRVGVADFALASVGMLPGTILYVYYGRLAGEVAVLARDGAATKGPGDYVLLGVGLVATVLVTAFVTRTAKRALETTQAGVANRDAKEQNQ